jgi:pimeloyl-ACP methyl ester carboxylesterase
VRLFGQSDGATIALVFAAHYPERVRSVMIEAPHVYNDPHTLAGIRQTISGPHVPDLLQKLGVYHPNGRAQELFEAWHQTWLHPAYQSWDIRSLLPQVVAPVLLIQGSADEYGSVGLFEAARDGVGGPCQAVWLPACGHFPHKSHTAEVFQLAWQFAQTYAPNPTQQ